MTSDEIDNYITMGSQGRVCVHREIVKGTSQFVQSVYLAGNAEDCYVSFEFDPIDMVDDGEGWNWQAKTSRLKAVAILEAHFGKEIGQWENISRTGRLDHSDGDTNAYNSDELRFREELETGAKLLPAELNWA